MNKRGKSSPSNPSQNSFMQQSERKPSRTRSPRGKSPSGRMSPWPCKDYLKGTCTNSFCNTLQSACSTRPRVVVGLVKSARMHTVRMMNKLIKRSKKIDDKSAVAMLKKNDWHESVWQPVVNRDESHERSGRHDVNRGTCHELKRGPVRRRSSNARQLGCVLSYGRAQTCRNQIQRVKFTKAIARHTKTRDQNPSLGYICPGEPHQRSPNAPKFEDRSQEETEWQEQGARGSSMEAGQKCIKIKGENNATFSSPSENRCLPASTPKPEEREFVVDSGASMHMISKKDLSDAEMDTLTKSCSPTIVITANGEVQTHEEATVYVKELDIFLTMNVLENTPAVLSLGKLCDENGYSYEWINGQKPHLIKDGIRIPCNTENFVPIVVPGLSTNSSSGSDSSTSRTLSRQGSHCSTSSSSSSSSPTVRDTKTREREDRTESDIFPVTLSTTVDELSGRPDIDQANENPKPKRTTERTETHVVEGTE